MARYVITHRLAGKLSAAERRSSRNALEAALKRRGIRVPPAPEDPRARLSLEIEAEPAEFRAHRKALPPDTIIEPRIMHRLHSGAVPKLLPRLHSLETGVHGGGRPVSAARVGLWLQDGATLVPLPPALSGRDGTVTLSYPDSIKPTVVVAQPLGGFWAMYAAFRKRSFAFECPPLPSGGPLGWWHQVLGISEYDESRGRGIRIGVVGTGVGPHPCLSHVSLIDGKTDVDRHETHVCGILGARPVHAGQYAGIAPGAEIFSACVYRQGPGGPVAEHQGVLAHAIDTLARSRNNAGFEVDLINLSLGYPQKSEVLRDAIRYALEHGVLCVCSAGNNGGPIDYPAALSETVAVAALGRKRWAPRGSISSHWEPSEKAKHGAGGLFLASLSSFGKRVSCAAPGIGILSTMPAQPGHSAPYASLDGTSLASPMTCGALAVLLSLLPEYLKMPRDTRRARMARTVLRTHCASIRLKLEFQGAGVPRIS
jgi:subtilase family protein